MLSTGLKRQPPNLRLGREYVYITSSLEVAKGCAERGVEIVAIDGSNRPRKDGLTFAETIAGLRNAYPNVLVMAYCDSVDAVDHAVEAGADLFVATLASYTESRIKTNGPDFEFIHEIKGTYPGFPAIAEGHIHIPAQVP